MRYTEIVTNIERKQILNQFSLGKRLDGRDLYTHREIKIETGIIEKAEGSARVYLGETDVLVGIKIDLGEPFSDVPNKGVLTVNAELVPLASPTFEPGPPNEVSIEIARVVDRGIREAKTIDLEKLCVEPGKKVFVVFVDIYVLNHAGNLIDASALASIAALLNTKYYNYKVEDGEVVKLPGYQKLPIKNYPIAVTFWKIDDYIFLDPSLDEERIADARLTVTPDKDGKICAIQKGGRGQFTLQEITHIANLAIKKAEELRKIVTGEKSWAKGKAIP